MRMIQAAGLLLAASAACLAQTPTVQICSSFTSRTVAGGVEITCNHDAPQGAAAAPAGFGIPAEAVSSGDVTGAPGWHWTHDSGTPGNASGTSTYPVPGVDGALTARRFDVSYVNHGGERFSVVFAKDATSTHHVYDVWVYFDDPSQIKNLELDINQVITDGRTVIYATQCSGNVGRWEFTIQKKWVPSNIPCDPKHWAPKAWHHIQVASHRDETGDVVTYDWVQVDGKYSAFDHASGLSALPLHWERAALQLQFQLNGASGGDGTVTAYADRFMVHSW